MSSLVWNFFEKPESSIDSLRCPKCNLMMVYKGTTSGLLRHMRSKHPIDYQRCVEQQSANTSYSESHPFLYPEPIREPRELLATSFCTGQIPFNFVDNPDFLKFCKSLNPSFKAPDSEHLREITEDVRANHIAIVRGELQNAKNFVLITNAFSYYKLPFFSVHVSYVNATTFQRKTFLCGMKHIENIDSLDMLSEIKKILEPYDLDLENCTAAIFENRKDKVDFMKNFKNSLNCAGHEVDLIIKRFLKRFPIVNSLSVEVKKVFRVLRTEYRQFVEMKRADFEMRHRNVKLEPLLPFPCPKWKYTFSALKSYGSNASCFWAVVPLQPVLLNDEELMNVRNLVLFLQPIYNALEELTKETSFLSDIVPNLLCVKEELNWDDEWSNALVEIIQERINAYLSEDLIILAMLSDPRYAYIPNLIEPRTWKEAEELFAKHEIPSLKPDTSSETRHFDQNTTSSGIGGLLKRKLNNCEDLTKSLASELLHYQAMMTTHRPSHTSDPLLFWKEQEQNYPKMTEIAVKFLAAMASSSPADKIYNKCSNLSDPKMLVIDPEDKDLYLMGHALTPENRVVELAIPEPTQYVEPFGPIDDMRFPPPPLSVGQATMAELLATVKEEPI